MENKKMEVNSGVVSIEQKRLAREFEDSMTSQTGFGSIYNMTNTTQVIDGTKIAEQMLAENDGSITHKDLNKLLKAGTDFFELNRSYELVMNKGKTLSGIKIFAKPLKINDDDLEEIDKYILMCTLQTKLSVIRDMLIYRYGDYIYNSIKSIMTRDISINITLPLIYFSEISTEEKFADFTTAIFDLVASHCVLNSFKYYDYIAEYLAKASPQYAAHLIDKTYFNKFEHSIHPDTHEEFYEVIKSNLMYARKVIDIISHTTDNPNKDWLPDTIIYAVDDQPMNKFYYLNNNSGILFSFQNKDDTAEKDGICYDIRYPDIIDMPSGDYASIKIYAMQLNFVASMLLDIGDKYLSPLLDLDLPNFPMIGV